MKYLNYFNDNGYRLMSVFYYFSRLRHENTENICNGVPS